MSRDLKLLTLLLQNVWGDISSWYKIAFPYNDIFLTCTNRPVEEQVELYARGRTKSGNISTDCDGLRKLSKHNHIPAKAFDFALKDHGIVVWNDEMFAPVIKAIKESKYNNLVRCAIVLSNGTIDWPHVEEI